MIGKRSQTTIWRVWFDIPWPVGMLCLHILSLSLLGNHLFYYLKSDTRRYIIFFAWGYVIYFKSMQIFPSFNGGKHLIEIISPQQDSLLNTQNLFYVKIGITICNLKVTGFDVWLHYNAPLALYTIWKIMVWAHPQLFRWEIRKQVCWHIYIWLFSTNFDGFAPSILGYGKIRFIANLLGGIYFCTRCWVCIFLMCHWIYASHVASLDDGAPGPVLLIYHHI